MKTALNGHVEIGYLTMFGALKLNRNHVMALETWLKIPQNHINSLKFFIFSFKLKNRKSLCLPVFRAITESIFNHVSRVIT